MKRIFRISTEMKTLLLTGLLAIMSLLTSAQVAENDFSFTITGTGFNSLIYAMAVQPDNKIVVGGDFTSYNGTTRKYIARLNADGTLDNTFDAGTTLSSAVLTLAIEPGGTILVGGAFTGAIKRLTSTGAADASLTLTGTGLAATGYVQTLALQADGKIMVGGTFTQYDATSRNRIAMLNTNGTLDATFNPGTGLNGIPRAIAIQPDGMILVVGGSSGFSTYNGTSADNIVRIQTNGTIDGGFTPPALLLARMYDVKLQTDNKIIVTGEYNGNINSIFNGVARLNTNGTIDNTFTPTFFQGGRSIAIQSDGKIVIGGAYSTSFPSAFRRLNTNGTTDTQYFNGEGFYYPASGQTVYSMAMQGGKIIAAGYFIGFNGHGRQHITRLTTCGSVGISTQPVNVNACENNTASFSVVATGSGLGYQWQSRAGTSGLFQNVTNGGAFSGSTSSTLSINPVTGTGITYYRCLVTDAVCSTTSGTATLSISTPPVINTQPTGKIICENAGTSFTIDVTNSGSYQWQEDKGSGFVDVASTGIYTGSTSATLNLSSVTVSMTGYLYRCKVGNCSPSVFSGNASLTVNASPVITTQPTAPAIICTGGNAQFSVIATNASTYQWQEKIGVAAFANVTDGGIYGGATTNTLIITGATTSQNSNQYRCIVTGANTCASTSAAAFLNVYAIPVVSTHPANSTKCAGTNTTFTVAVTSPVNGLTYQWQEKVGSGSFTNLTNGGVYSTVTTATLTLTAVTAGMNGNKYRCVVGTCATPVVSFDADLIVDSPPVVTLQPVASTICAGMTTTFTTNATGLGVTFKWQKETSAGSFSFADITNGGIYSGASTETLTLTNAQLNDSGYKYRCVITASGVCAGVNTSNVNLTVRAVPTFNTQPVDKAVCEGLTTSFNSSVNFNGGSSAYQWQINEFGIAFIDLAPNTTLYPNGVNSSSLAVSPTLLMNGNKYRVRVGTCQPEVFSSEVTLTVNQTPAITSQPVNKTVCYGESVTFSVGATGTGLTYQWQVSGSAGGYTGGDTPTLTLTTASIVHNGQTVSCIVKGVAGCTQVTSVEATLTVNGTTLTTQPAPASVCSGGNQTFTVAAEGPSLTYQWKSSNGVDVTTLTNGGIYSGATSANLSITGATISTSYLCVVTSTCGSVTSSSATLTVTTVPKPTIVVNTSNPESPTLIAGGGSTYQWFKNGTAISGATSSAYNVTTEGSYTVQAKINGCVSEMSAAQAVIVTGDIDRRTTSLVKVYPNPGSDQITLSLGGFEKDKPVSISIVDIQGRVMEKTTGLGQHEVSIDIRDYAVGKYIALLQQRATKVSQQFIKSDK